MNLAIMELNTLQSWLWRAASSIRDALVLLAEAEVARAAADACLGQVLAALGAMHQGNLR